MHAELANRTCEKRAAIRGPVRHALVGALVALSWSPSTFEDAAHSLALLAEAENDTVANNATSEFLQRFSIFFSGTAVPYAVRMHVLDTLMAAESDELKRLAFRAMARVAVRRGLRIHRPPITRGLPEAEWQPTTGQEHVSAARLGLDRMRNAIATGTPALTDTAATVVSELRMLLLEEPVRAQVIDLIAATAHAYPSQREALRRSVSELLYRDRKHWHKLGSDGESAVETLVHKLEDHSLSGRLRQLVGPSSHEEDEPSVLAIAADFVTQPDALAAEWAWLTNGDARRVWSLGGALGASNIDEAIMDLVDGATMGPDGRIVCAYLTRRAKDEGVEWLETLLDELWRARRDRADSVLEATWRLTPTERGAARVVDILRAGQGSPALLGQLAYGTWEDCLGPAMLRPVLYALASRPDGLVTALAILSQRLRKHPGELDMWTDLALMLVTNGSLIRGEHDESWEWKELANLLVPRFPREIYRAIVREQGRQEERHWFLGHELAAEIVSACVEADPVGAWDETRPYLEAKSQAAHRFAIGFPEGLIDMMDHTVVIRWTGEDPSHRGSVLADIVAKSYSDETLAGKIIEAYGGDEDVARAFHSSSISGPWVGSSAEHWASMARQMHSVAEGARGPVLRRWAARTADILEEMAARDRVREEEEPLRGR